jgi:hypothetical protein
MSYKKEQWTKPQLIVLARGTPEENVLTHCKRIGNTGITNPTSTAQLGCDSGASNNCANCQSRSGS